MTSTSEPLNGADSPAVAAAAFGALRRNAAVAARQRDQSKVVVVTTCEGKKDRSGDPGFSEFLHVQFLCSLHKPIMYVYITCIYIYI